MSPIKIEKALFVGAAGVCATSVEDAHGEEEATDDIG